MNSKTVLTSKSTETTAMQIVPFESQSNLPAYLSEAPGLLDINKEVVRAAAFPVMSIKGMKFTMVQDGVRRVLTKPDDPEEVAQSIGVVFLRANMHAKTFYAKKYSEGDSDGARPDCYSYDGVAPSANAQAPQAKKCAVCPHNQWGSRVGDGDQSGEGKGKACQDNARIAISTPDNMNPTLLRVPPASLKGLKEMLKVVASRKVPYNAVVVKIGFDREAPSPKLTFKPVGLMDDAGYQRVKALYEDDVVRAVVGLDDLAADPAEVKVEPKVDADELDAALAARAVTQKAKEKAKPVQEDEAPAPKAEKKAKVKVEVDEDEAPAPKAEKKASAASDLLADLDDLLGSKDD
jgi:hypothetical protein